MKRLFVALLAVAMMMNMAACGGRDGSAEASSSSADSVTDEVSESTDDGDNAEVSISSVDANSDAAESDLDETEGSVQEESVATQSAILYPIGDDITISLWGVFEDALSEAMDDWSQLSVLPNVANATGVNLEISSTSNLAASEQFSLMVASGDWPDLLPIVYYTGGDSAAYADGVIADLTDLLPEYAPMYWSYVQNSNATTQSALRSGEKYLTMYTLLDEYYYDKGAVIRQDWLDELEMSMPETLDELTVALKAFYDNYQPEYTIYTSDGALTYLNDVFGTSIVGYSNNDLPLYILEGEVVCTYTMDEYRNYLEWFNELYDYGIVNSDFYSLNEIDSDARNTNIVTDQTALWTCGVDAISVWESYVTDDASLESCNPEPMPYLTDDDGEFNWGAEQSYVFDRVAVAITTTADVEMCLSFLDYFFTEEGSILANYGTENFTWEYDDNGNIAWTDIVLNNPDGFTAQLAVNAYTTSYILPCYDVNSKMFVTYSDDGLKAIEVYNDNISSDYAYPSGAEPSSEAYSAVTDTITSINTYAAEKILMFMTGSLEISDETWEEFQNELSTMGLENVLAVYTESYAEYLSE